VRGLRVCLAKSILAGKSRGGAAGAGGTGEANLYFREQALDRLATRGICCRAGAGGTGFAALCKAAEGQLDPCEDLNELTARTARGRRAPRSHRDRCRANCAHADPSDNKRYPARVTRACSRRKGRQLDYFSGARLRATRERTGTALDDRLTPSFALIICQLNNPLAGALEFARDRYAEGQTFPE